MKEKEWVRGLAELTRAVAALSDKVEQVDRQSRCRHVWETAETPSGRRCAECGCEPLKR